MREETGAGDDPAPRANILLVDDQPANLLALEATLSDLGQNLVTARSGDDALRLLLQEDFAVILLDVQMQGLDGFATAQLIRGRERTRHTPIIFLTAYDTGDFPVERAYQLGAVDYLVKPLLPVILRAKTVVFVDLFHKTERLRRLERREFERRLAEASRRQAEEERGRRESEQRSRRLTEFHEAVMGSMGEGLFALDAEGRLTYMNPAAELLLGWKAEELLGLPTHDHIHYKHPDGSPLRTEDCPILRVRTGGSTLRNHQDFFVRKDGATFPVACSSAPIVSDAATAGLVVVFRDVTRQKQAEQELSDSERRYRALADSMPQIVWSARPDGRLDYFNRRWYEYTGFPEGQTGDDSWKPILHPDDLQRCVDTWYGAVRSGEVFQIECRFKDRISGGYRWHLGRALPVRDAAGRIERWFGTCTDIDDQKRLEEGLREANAAKDQFLMMLAHELRNPLAPLLSSLYVVGQDEAMRKVHGQALGRMERQVRRLDRILEDMLGASEVVLGRTPLRSERLDLSRLVRTAAEDRRPLLEQGGVGLTVEAPDTPVWVWGDADRLAQVLDNLLDNAARFVDRGGRVNVRLTAESPPPQPSPARGEGAMHPPPPPSPARGEGAMHPPPQPSPLAGEGWGGGWAILSFSDTGIGIAPDMLGRLFDVFAQADRSLDRKRGGLGLGLAVVKGLVEQHGGAVRADSAGLGRGAEFTVCLPLQPEPAALSPTSEPPEQTGARARVLVIEDNHDAAESLRMLLEILGHEVRVAFTGSEGLQRAFEWVPNVVLSDIGLPEMDGYEVARRLRREPSFGNVLLVAITGYNAEEDRRRSREAGFDHHLGKPADVRELQRVLAAHGA